MTDTVPELALAARNIAFQFGKKKVLHDVNINVPSGKFVALLGANGAGKTTLFSILTGLYASTGGAVEIGQHDLRRDTQRALANIGVVFQRATLDRDLTVAQNLRYFCDLQGIVNPEANERIDEALNAHGLGDMKQLRITELSGGQQRRVELARSLLHRPGVLLLDEPTVGLDYRNRLDFVNNVKPLCREYNTGVLWATHLMDEVEDADYIYILHKGELLSHGEASELRKVHQQESVADLFRALTKNAEQDNIAGTAS